MSDEKKLIVDEDWKSKVHREKEEARLKAEQAQAPAAEAGAEPAPGPEEAAGDDAEGSESPEAEGAPRAVRFNDLLGMLASQALYALGAMPGGDGRQVMVDLDQAKFIVELLDVLEEKTRGNLSTEEAEHLHEARNEIGRIFAVRLQQVQEQAMRQAGVDPANLQHPGGQPG